VFREGDIVSVTYRSGSDRTGKPVLKTLENAEVLSCDSNRLVVGYRDASSLKEVKYVKLSFDMKDSDLLVKECIRK
jgi:hypothetical protein